MVWWWTPLLFCRPPRRRKRRSKRDKDPFGPSTVEAASWSPTSTTTASSQASSYQTTSQASNGSNNGPYDDAIPLLFSHRKDFISRRKDIQNFEQRLVQAVQTGNVIQARQCLKRGSSACTTSRGQSVLYLAVRQANSLAMVQLLLQYGADVSVTTSEGRNQPIHAASWTGNTEIIAVLVSHGAAVDALNAHGQTPLHWAAKLGHAALVQFLLAKGASIRIRNHQNQTPMDIAHNSIVSLLRDATFWGLVLTRQGWRTHTTWLGRLVGAIETLAEAQIMALLLKLSVAQDFVTLKQAQGWMHEVLVQLPEQPGWSALVRDCRQDDLLPRQAFTHVTPASTSPRLLYNRVHLVSLGLEFQQQLQMALRENPVHLQAVDGSPGALYKHLLLYCRALLRVQSARSAGLACLAETSAMEVTARAVVLVLQLSQMARNCPVLTVLWGRLHLLDSIAAVAGSLEAPAARRAYARGQALATRVLQNLDDDHVYVPLSQATADVGVVLGVVTTLLEQGIVKPLDIWGSEAAIWHSTETREVVIINTLGAS